MTPQQIRDRLTSKDGTFQKSLIEYLNGCHNGEFLEGVQAEVENRVLPLLNKDPKIGRKEVKDPIINVPKSPPDDCKLQKDPERHIHCSQCKDTLKWTCHFKSTVDKICTTSIDMTAAKDSVKVLGTLDARPGSFESLLKRVL